MRVINKWVKLESAHFSLCNEPRKEPKGQEKARAVVNEKKIYSLKLVKIYGIDIISLVFTSVV